MKVRCQKGVINRSFQSPTILYNISYYIILYPLIRYNINDLWNIIAQKCGKSNDKLGILMGNRWEIYEKSMRNLWEIDQNLVKMPTPNRASQQRRLAAEAPPSCQRPRLRPGGQGSPATGQSLGNDWGTTGEPWFQWWHKGIQIISWYIQNIGKLWKTIKPI